MSAQIIPFPGVIQPDPPAAVSFDEARPGWEQEIAELAKAIEYAEDSRQWVQTADELARVLMVLSASITHEA